MTNDPKSNDRDELRQQIWEFVYELLDEAEAAAMQDRITSEPDTARLYSEIKQQSNLLSTAAKLEQAPVALDRPGEATAEETPPASEPAAAKQSMVDSAAARSPAANWFVAIAASLILAVVGYAYFGPESPLNADAVARFEQELEEEQPHIQLTSPAVAQSEIENIITVNVTTKEGEPKPARIEYTAYETREGKQILETQEVETNELGQAFVSIPGEKLVGPARIEMIAHYDNGKSKRIDTHLDLDETRFSTHLSLDKPLYRPGEEVYFRSVTLSRFGMWPVELAEVEYEILDAGEAPVDDSQSNGVTMHGVGSGQFVLPVGSPGGTYTLVARSPQDLFPEERREFQVREYRPIQFKKELELIRDSYTPGDEVVADFAAWRGTGEPLSNTNVTVQASVDGNPIDVPEPGGLTDDDGTYRVRFTLPDTIEKGEGVVVVQVDDGATRETIAETIPINLGKVEVDFFPEGGDLAAGLPNRVYFSARDPVGEPVHIEGRVVDSAGKEVAKLETEHEGRGRFDFTPSAVDVYTVEIDSPAKVTSKPELPAARADLAAIVSSDEFVYDAKSPLTLSLRTRKKTNNYVVAAMCRGAQVGQLSINKPQFKKIKKSGATDEHFEAKLEIPVSQAADGVVRLTLYDYSQNPPRPVAERLVYRRPHHKLNVRVGGHSESYSPGALVNLNFLVTDETGEPAEGVLGVSVVDDSLLNLADDKSARMTTHFRLTTEIDKPEDLEDANFFLTDKADAPSALDLLLGVQGWRRFANTPAEVYAYLDAANGIGFPPPPDDTPFAFEADAEAAAEEHRQEQIARLAQIDGVVQPPQVADNTDGLAAELATAVSTFHDQRGEQIRLFGKVLAGAALFVFLAVAVAALMRRTSGAVVWAPAMLAAIGCLAVGVMWTRAYVEPSGQIAYAPMSLDDPLGDMVAMNSIEESSRMAPSATAADPSETDWAEEEVDAMMVMEAAPMAGAAGGLDPLDLAAPMDDAAGAFGGPPPPLPLPAAPQEAPAPNPEPAAQPGLGAFAADPGLLPPGNNDDAFGGRGERFVQQGKQGQAFGANAIQAERAAQLFRGNEQEGGDRDLAERNGFAREMLLKRRAGMEFGDLAQDERRRLEALVFEFRIYSHEHFSRKPNVREDFHESLYWNPLLVADETGNAQVKFELSDSITMFRVRTDAHTKAADDTITLGRIGSGEGEVISRIPFRLEPKLPLEVTTGDRIDLPVAVINDSRDALAVDVNVQLSDLLTLNGPVARTINVDANGRHREWFELNVTGFSGEADLTLSGLSQHLDDAISKSIRITQPGFPIEESYAGALEGEQQLTIDLPENWIEGSLEVTLKAFPSTLADIQKGVEGILREPNGCFEQTSSSNYPNIMALQYMQQHDVADPTFTKRAKELLDRGYQKLVTFESPKEGYEWFGGDPGHEALTAYGLMEFRDMQQVYDVDEKMVERTAEWLLERRDGTGGFRRNARALDSFGRAPQHITDAYIVWALTEAGQEGISTELIHVIELAKKSDDPYLVAMAARSALNADKTKQGIELLEKLSSLQADDGHLDPKESTITRSGGISAKVETTALATMAWLKDPSGSTSARKAVEWITSSRQGAGGFGSTQATILALKALTEYANANRKTTSAGELLARVTVKEEAAKEEATDADASDAGATDNEASSEEASSAESRGSEGADASAPSIPEPPAIEDDAATTDSVGEEDIPAADTVDEPVADEPVADEPPADDPAADIDPEAETTITNDQPAEPQAITKSVSFAAGDSEAIELVGLEAFLKAGKNELTIDLTGDNQMPYVLDVRYRVEKPRSHDACPIRLTTALASDKVVMGESVSLDVTVENVSDEGQPMTTAIIGIPAGLEVRVEQLDEMKKAGKFAYYELNAREIILYWRDMAPELKGDAKLAFSLDLIAEVPGKYTGPASRAYLYYTAEQKQWLEPLVVEVTRP